MRVVITGSPPPGDVEHEHAADGRRHQVCTGVHGEEESEDCSLLQTLNPDPPLTPDRGGEPDL